MKKKTPRALSSTADLHPLLKDASLDKAAELANSLVWHNDARRHPRASRIDPGQVAWDLSFMLEYLRLNFELIPKDPS